MNKKIILSIVMIFLVTCSFFIPASNAINTPSEKNIEKSPSILDSKAYHFSVCFIRGSGLIKEHSFFGYGLFPLDLYVTGYGIDQYGNEVFVNKLHLTKPCENWWESRTWVSLFSEDWVFGIFHDNLIGGDDYIFAAAVHVDVYINW
jgi:hypothetical protein